MVYIYTDEKLIFYVRKFRSGNISVYATAALTIYNYASSIIITHAGAYVWYVGCIRWGALIPTAMEETGNPQEKVGRTLEVYLYV